MAETSSLVYPSSSARHPHELPHASRVARATVYQPATAQASEIRRAFTPGSPLAGACAYSVRTSGLFEANVQAVRCEHESAAFDPSSRPSRQTSRF